MNRLYTLGLMALSLGTNAQNVHEYRMSKHLQAQGGTRGGGGLVINTTDSLSLSGMISATIFGGCVQISNLTWTGNVNAFGQFTDPSMATGIDDGLILSTGAADSAGGAGTQFVTTSWGTAGDAYLDGVAGAQTFDAAILEFDFSPISDTIFASDFVFGSEEYPEFVNSSFNDAFAFLISGPGIAGEVNVATLPGSSTPISINNVNDQLNQTYYIDNQNGTMITYDGLTTMIGLQHAVVPGQTYHFRILIADAGDQIYDSGVFIRAQSFCGNFWYQTAEFVAQPNGLTYAFENLSQSATDFMWDFGDGNFSTEINPTHTYAMPGNYSVALTSTNMCFDTTSVLDLDVMLVDVNSQTAEHTAYLSNTDPDHLTLNFSSKTTVQVQYSLLDAVGRTLIPTTNIGLATSFRKDIEVGQLPHGTYLFQLLVDGRPTVLRFMR